MYSIPQRIFEDIHAVYLFGLGDSDRAPSHDSSNDSRFLAIPVPSILDSMTVCSSDQMNGVFMFSFDHCSNETREVLQIQNHSKCEKKHYIYVKKYYI